MSIIAIDYAEITGLTNSGTTDGTGTWNTGIDLSGLGVPSTATGVFVFFTNSSSSNRWAGIRDNGKSTAHEFDQIGGRDSYSRFVSLSNGLLDVYRQSSSVSFYVIAYTDENFTAFDIDQGLPLQDFVAGENNIVTANAAVPATATAMLTSGNDFAPTSNGAAFANGRVGENFVVLDAALQFYSSVSSQYQIIGYDTSPMTVVAQEAVTVMADGTWRLSDKTYPFATALFVTVLDPASSATPVGVRKSGSTFNDISDYGIAKGTSEPGAILVGVNNAGEFEYNFGSTTGTPEILIYAYSGAPPSTNIDGDNKVNQYQQSVESTIVNSPESITSVSIDGIAHTIQSQSVDANNVRTLILERIESLGDSGTKTITFTDATTSYTLDFEYTELHPVNIPAGPADDNSVMFDQGLGSNYDGSAYMSFTLPVEYTDSMANGGTPVFRGAQMTFKDGYGPDNFPPLEDINMYLEAPVGFTGWMQTPLERIYPDGTTDAWALETNITEYVAVSPSQEQWTGINETADTAPALFTPQWGGSPADWTVRADAEAERGSAALAYTGTGTPVRRFMQLDTAPTDLDPSVERIDSRFRFYGDPATGTLAIPRLFASGAPGQENAIYPTIRNAERALLIGQYDNGTYRETYTGIQFPAGAAWFEGHATWEPSDTGKRMKISIWADSDPEPATWMMEADPQVEPVPGNVGYGLVDDGVHKLDWLSFGFGGSDAVDLYLPPPSIVGAGLADTTVIEQGSLNLDIAAAFNDEETLSVSGPPDASGFSLSSGSLTGSPSSADLTASPYTVTATATNLKGSVSDAFTLTVDLKAVVAINDVDSITGSPALSGTVNETDATISVNIDANDYAATNNGDGTWDLPAGAIASLQNGLYTATATATDTGGNITSATGDVFVALLTQDSAIPDIVFSESGLAGTDFSAYFTGATSYALTGLATGTGFSLNASTGILSGTATAADIDNSPFTLSITASNTAGSLDATAMLSVVDSPALLEPLPDISLKEGESVDLDAFSYFDGADSYALTGLPAGSGLSFNAAIGVLSGTLNQADVDAGEVTLTVTAENNAGTSTDSFQLLAIEATPVFQSSVTLKTVSKLRITGYRLNGHRNAPDSRTLVASSQARFAAGVKSFNKQPAEVLDYDLDLAAWVTDLGDTIKSVEHRADAGITVDTAYLLPNNRYKIWLSGGAPSRSHPIAGIVTTFAGRVAEFDMRINVRDYQ